MAESADHSNSTERYAAIEQAYCADQWGEVIDQGQSLLREIPRASGPMPEGLKERVQLLMAHAHLYGFNERDIAEDLYSDVLHSKAELALRQIAEQGLQQCSLSQQESPAVIEAGKAAEASPVAAAEAPTAAPTPAQSQAPASLQANASELCRPELLSQELKGTADTDRAAALGAETALPAQSPAPAASLAAASVNPATNNQPVASSAAATPAAPSSDTTGSLAMPWMVTGAMASTTAAAAASASAPTPWATAATQPATPEPTPSPEAQAQQEAGEPLPPQPVATAGEALAPLAQPSAPLAQPTALDVTLIPEVVEEPELFEVHQADPLLAEELELTVMEPEPPIAVTAAEIVELPGTSLSAAAAIASAAILGAAASPAAAARTPANLTGQEKQTLKPEPGPEPAPGHEQNIAPGEPQSLLSLTKETPDFTADADVLCELFRNPPAPVEEEDPELLLGLLRVLVSADSAGDGG